MSLAGAVDGDLADGSLLGFRLAKRLFTLTGELLAQYHSPDQEPPAGRRLSQLIQPIAPHRQIPAIQQGMRLAKPRRVQLTQLGGPGS